MKHELETNSSETSPAFQDGPPAPPNASLPAQERGRGEEAPPPNETEEQTFAALARLTPSQYDRVRKAEARRKTFGPAVLAGIGALPDILHDSSIRVLLLPAEPGQKPSPVFSNPD